VGLIGMKMGIKSKKENCYKQREVSDLWYYENGNLKKK
jgi:hypothetical protein